MKLQKRLAMLTAGAMLLTSMPVWANDYSNHWAKGAIERWSTNGVVQGYEDGSFKPNQKVTRAELASFVVRVFGLTEVSNAKQYDDVQKGQWYTTAIDTVSSAGIMKDYGASFNPNDFATREETAHVLANAYELTGTSPQSFDDEELISAWAKEQVGAMVQQGILKGKTETTIAPQDSVTRAEVVTMLDRLTAEFYNQSGTYTPNADGNVVVNTKDVILKDATIKGNLYIAEGVGNGDVVLDNTTVTGKVIIEGGGENSIKFVNGSKAKNIKVEKEDGKVRVFVDDKSSVANAVLESGAKIDGNMGAVEVQTTQPVQILSGTINSLEVSKNIKDATITLGDKVQVKEAVFNAPVQVKGKGKIEKASVNVEGVKLETQPGHTTLPEDIKVSIGGTLVDKDAVNKPIIGVGSGSAGGSSSSDDSNSGGGSNGGGETVNKPQAIVTPSKVSQFQVSGTGADIEINLKDTKLTIKEAYDLWKAIKPTFNLNGSVGTNIVDEDTFRVHIRSTMPMDELPSHWEFVLPASILSTDKDIKVSVPIVQDTPEEVLELALNGIPDKFQISIDEHGDNVFRVLETWTGASATPELEMGVEVLAFHEYIDNDGTINYPENSIGEAIPMNITIRYKGMEQQKQVFVALKPLSDKDDVPNGTERLITTPGAITISEGDRVTFTVTTSSAIFVKDLEEAPISYKRNGGFEVETSTPQISEDGKTLTFDAEFKNVRAGARFDFYIPEEWFIDGEYRQTELIIVKKK
ncbi:MAG: S-layer homology domain-containing protein [Niameybacter sp.]